MFVATAIVGSVFLHLAVLRWMWQRITARVARFTRLMVGFLVLIAIITHLAEITLFAGAMQAIQLWSEPPAQRVSFDELWYASAAAYTSLEAHTFPDGWLRTFIAVEALTGLILITWTASFLFLAMQRLWDWRTPHQDARPGD